MSAAGRIGLGVAAGYLLGRTKKMRLAITVGSMLAGQRVATDRAGIMRQLGGVVENNPELSKLRDQITGRMLEAAKSAAIATATSRLEGVTDSLRGLPAAQQDSDDDEYADDEDQYEDDEYDDAEEGDESAEGDDSAEGDEEDEAVDEAPEGDDDDEVDDQPDDQAEDGEDQEDQEDEEDEEDAQPEPPRRARRA